jgi:hypothetical protein
MTEQRRQATTPFSTAAIERDFCALNAVVLAEFNELIHADSIKPGVCHSRTHQENSLQPERASPLSAFLRCAENVHDAFLQRI